MTRHYGWRIVIALAIALLAPTTYAQDRPLTVNGQVTDAETGETLPGANVRIVGTQIGTTTDINGRYELELSPAASLLEVTFVGYRTREVSIPEASGTITLDVRLQEDVLGIDEVVVSGLASSVKRSNLASSVETISARELAEISTPQTLDGAISGKITGGVITSNTGAPGGGIAVKLRGITTINGESQPLFIVDGVILNNDAISNGVNAVTAAAAGGNASSQDQPANRIADLNPEDVESIEILKGPSAAAIYGARASNGVVIIQTKRGNAGGGVQFSVRQSLGFTTIVNKVGTRRFTEETAVAQYGPSAPRDDATPAEIAEFQAGQQEIRDLFNETGGAFIDYEDEFYGNAGLLSTTSLSASGGNDRTQFFVSGLIKDDEGIIENTGYEKQSARVNITHRFSSKFSADVTANYVRSTALRGLTGNDNSGTTFGVSLTATPSFIDILPNEDGTYPDHPFNTSNPFQVRDLASIEETTNRVIASGRITYNVFQQNTQGLQAILEGGADFFNLDQDARFPEELQFYEGAGLPGQSIQGRTNNLNANIRGALVHTLSLPEPNVFFTTQAGFTAFTQDQDIVTSVGAGLVPDQFNVDLAASLQTNQQRLVQDDRAFFVQEEVNYADRVVATLGFRAERSSLNGDVDELYFYPKASLAANLAEFPFWNVDLLDQAKLRVAFGQTGNTAAFGSKFTIFNPIAVGGGLGIIIGGQRGFPDVEPERATEIEGGFDVAGFDGRANLEFTVYRKVIDDLLLTREVEPSSGFTLETLNGGQLTNTGFEVGLSLIPVNTRTVRWVTRTNFWTNDAEVTELTVPSFRALGGGFGNTLGSIQIEEGQSPTQIIGIDDIDGDGSADGVFVLGDAAPDFQMSFLNDVTLFKNLRLTIFAHWKKGGDNLNLSELLTDLGGTSPDFDENAGERLSQLGVSARQFVQDASYLKIREIGLYYTVPDEAVGRYLPQVRGLSVGVSANNAFVFTPYKSYDPEVNNFGTQPVATGVEVTPFPSSRSFLFHISFGL
ncbi:MAG: SusC/RagA family TonB-linked outer membrane protein [Bacteroidota bacterium]